MDSSRISATTIADSAKLQSAASNMLSGLSAMFDSNKSANGMFAALLSTVQSAPQGQPKPAETTPPPAAAATPASTTDASNTDHPVNARLAQRHGSSGRAATIDATAKTQTTARQTAASTLAPANDKTLSGAKQDQDHAQNNTADGHNRSDDADDPSCINSNAVSTTPTDAASAAQTANTVAASGASLTDPQTLAALASGLASTSDALGFAALPSSAASSPTSKLASTLAGLKIDTAASGAGKTDLQALMQAIKAGAAGKNAATASAADDAGDSGSATDTATTSGATAIDKKDFQSVAALKDLAATGTGNSAADDLTASFFDLFKNSFAAPAAVDIAAVPTATGNTVAAANAGNNGNGLNLDLRQPSGNNIVSAGTGDAVATDNTAMKSSASTYSFASQLAATRAPASTALPGAVEQVVLQMSRNIKSGNDQMTLQLNPAELGKINVKLSIADDGKVQGTVTADNPATLNLMVKDQASLERALQDAGFNAGSGSLQFNLGHSSGNGFGQTASHNNSAAHNANNASLAADDAADAAATEIYYLTPSGVNLSV